MITIEKSKRGKNKDKLSFLGSDRVVMMEILFRQCGCTYFQQVFVSKRMKNPGWRRCQRYRGAAPGCFEVFFSSFYTRLPRSSDCVALLVLGWLLMTVVATLYNQYCEFFICSRSNISKTYLTYFLFLLFLRTISLTRILFKKSPDVWLQRFFCSKRYPSSSFFNQFLLIAKDCYYVILR